MSGLNWEKAKQGPGRASTKDLNADQRAGYLKLGAVRLLEAARDLYRHAKRQHQPNPFCQRCTASLKQRRFAALCYRCLFRVGRHAVHLTPHALPSAALRAERARFYHGRSEDPTR